MQSNDWTSGQRQLMAKLLDECEAESRHSVESKRFRKRNYSDVDDIDLLVRRGPIQDSNLQYSVNVLYLLEIESSLASKICNDADLLWRAYHDEYLRDESDTVFLSAAAKAAGLEMDDAQRALHYMMQTGWHRGYATPADRLYSSVEVGEEVLKYQSFSEYLAQLHRQHLDFLQHGPYGASSFPRLTEQKPTKIQMTVKGDLPAWVSELPEGVLELLKETFQAKGQGWNRLAAMGCRTLFDMVSAEALTRDAKTFKEKLDAMVREEHITQTQKENLGAMVDAGSAAAHRGFNPGQEMVEAMWGIALNMLESYFVRKPQAQKLMGVTPKKPSSSKP